MQHKVESQKNYIKKYETYVVIFFGVFFSCVQAMDLAPLADKQSLRRDNHAGSPRLLATLARRSGSLGVAGALEEQQMDPVLEVSYHELALMEYITQRNVQGVQNTLKQPVNINLCCKDYHYHTPLAEAIGTGNEEIVRLILAHPGIKVNLPDNDNWTPLHVAAHLKLPGIACLLLQHGACLNVKTTPKNRTPLHEAVYQRHQGVVHVLLTEMPQKRLDSFVIKTAFPLLCCFVRWSKEECVQKKIPKDVQLLLCKYVVRANVDTLVQEQLAALQPVLESQDDTELKPFTAGISTTDLFAIPCCAWFNTVLNPTENKETRAALITTALLNKFEQLSLVSIPHNSDKLQNQPTEDTE